LNDIRIDATQLQRLQQAESHLQLALGQCDLAATRVEITARADCSLTVDDEPRQLSGGASETVRVVATVSIGVPGLADFRIVPPKSTAELEERVRDARCSLASAFEQCGVSNLAEAFAADARRKQASQNLAELN